MFDLARIRPTRRLKLRGRSLAGNAIIEFSLLMPWYVFLFVGTFDFGFYTYSLIAAESAAREGAVYCSANPTTATDATTACGYALDQLRNLPNIGYNLTTCTASPLVVAASSVAGADGNPATSVTVTYTTPQLIPIPGLLPGQVTINRTVQMGLRALY
jgi:Flp pilus assembly protein TadG